MRNKTLRNKLLVVLCLLCTLMFSAFIVACGGNGGNSGGNGGGGGGSVTPKTFPEDISVHIVDETGGKISVALSVYEVEVPIYSKYALSATTFGTKDTVTWTSANSDIAGVSLGGLVDAKALGTTEITASVGGASATCTVTVVETEDAPSIRLSSEHVALSKGIGYIVYPTLYWDGEVVEFDDYDVVIESGEDVVSAEYADGGVSIFGLDAGSAVVVVTAHAFERDVFAKFSVNVIDKLVSFLPKQTAVYSNSPKGGAYIGTVYAENATVEGVDYYNEISLVFEEYVDGDYKGDANVTWKFFNEDKLGVRTYISKPSGLTISEGVLKCQISGSYGLEGKVTTIDGGVEKTITVYVDAKYIELDVNEEKTIDISTIDSSAILPASMTYGDGVPFDAGKLPATNIKVYLGDTQIGNYKSSKISFSDFKSYLPQKATELGAKEIVIVTSSRKYTVQANIYTKIIRTKADLDSFRTLSAACGETVVEGGLTYHKTYDGYFILANDINYNGTFYSLVNSGYVYGMASRIQAGNWQDAANYGFKGVFDGLGHAIYGVQIENPSMNTVYKAPEFGYNYDYASECGGFIGYMNSLGTFRNVAFLNASVAENCSMVCSYGGGTVENVYIQYNKIGIGNANRDFELNSEGNIGSPRYIGSFYTMVAGDNAVVRNCIIDASKADTTYHVTKKLVGKNGRKDLDNYHLAGISSVMEDVILIMPDESVFAVSGANYCFLSYSDFENYEDDFDYLGWASKGFWKVKDAYIYCDAMVESGDIAFTNILSDEVNDINVGSSRRLETNKLYSYFTVENLSDELYAPYIYVDNTNSVVVGNEVPAGTTFTVKATYFFNDEITAEASFKVYEQLVVVESEETAVFDLDLVKSGDTYVGNSTEVEFDLSEFKTILGAKAYKVMLDEEYLGRDVDVVDNKITVLKSAIAPTYYGEHTLCVFTEKDGTVHEIIVPVFIKSKIITTADEFIALGGMADACRRAGYFELGADIVLSEEVGKNIYAVGFNGQLKHSDNRINYFAGTFDGMGYTVSNMYIAGGTGSGWIVTSNEAIVRNVAFTNVILRGSNRFVADGIVHFENVYVQIDSVISMVRSDRWLVDSAYASDSGYIVSNTANASTFTNVVVDFTVAVEEYKNTVVTANNEYKGMTAYEAAVKNYEDYLTAIENGWYEDAYTGNNASGAYPKYYHSAVFTDANAITSIVERAFFFGFNPNYRTYGGTFLGNHSNRELLKDVVLIGIPDERIEHKCAMRFNTASNGTECPYCVVVMGDELNNGVDIVAENWDATYWNVDVDENVAIWVGKAD